MSLNCLVCHILQRSDSDIDIESREDSDITENFVTSGYEKMVRNSRTDQCCCPYVVRRVKREHSRRYSEEVTVYGDLDEPKLVRSSSGLRRDWSYEDLMKQRDQIRIGETIKE
ncbi:hypothetical protein N665_4725s0003 [Sinapis alba]|nr:hypothetical protein N665_4725s0003 [Sinapis alba]